jgi:hypothetical protein
VFTFRTTETFDPASPAFAPEVKVIVYKDRTLGTGGAPVSGTGTIYFQGYITAPKMSAAGSHQSIHYQAFDARWYSERTPFKQTWKNFAGWVDNDPTKGAITVDQVASEVYIGETVNETLQTTAAQLTEIYTWLNRVQNPTWRANTIATDTAQNIVAIGTITPAFIFPRNRVNTISCAEAVNQVLRWAPDAMELMDYTTTPPTINVLNLSSLPTATLDLTAEQERAISVAPDIDRKLNGVIIYYKAVDTVNGAQHPRFFVDKYPTGITDFDPNISSHTVTLTGISATTLSCDVETEAITALTGADAAGQVAWWQARDSSLLDASIDPASIVITSPVITDAAGTTINLTSFPRVLLTNSLPDWIGANTVNAIISATVSYSKYATPDRLIATQNVSREVRKEVVLTNALTQTYTQLSHYDPGEVPPGWTGTAFVNGVAQQVYNGVKDLRHSGTITFLGAAVRTDLTVGTNCTLTGHYSTFTNCIVQRITTEPHYGRMTVTFGPVARMDAPALIELARASRFRPVFNAPSGRSTGQFGGSGVSVPQTASAPRDNTTHGLGQFSLQTAIATHASNIGGISNTAGTSQISLDAAGDQLTIKRVNPTTGAAITAAGSVSIPLAALGGKAATWQTVQVVCVGTRISATMLVLGTTPT